MSRYFHSILIFLGLSLVLTGCTKHQNETPPATAPAQTAASGQELNLAIWGNYLSPEMQNKFTATTGIKLNISNYSSNEELLAKVQAGGQFDVAVPSDYMVEVMQKQGLLAELKAELLPNIKNVKADLLKPYYDPENKYSYPYAMTTTGIAVNREVYKGEIKGWKDLFEKKDLKGKISMLDDVREVTGAALKMQGKSVNSTSQADLDSAKKALLALRPSIKAFTSDTIDLLTNKEVAVAQSYSSDALQASRKSGGKIEFILPVEGGTKAVDNLVIFKSTKNLEAAHTFINFMLSEEANVDFVKSVMALPVLKTTEALLPEDLKKNKALLPTSEQMGKLESIHDIGDSIKMYDRLWTELKAAK